MKHTKYVTKALHWPSVTYLTIGGPLCKGQNWAPIPHILLKRSVKYVIITSLTVHKGAQNVTTKLAGSVSAQLQAAQSYRN